MPPAADAAALRAIKADPTLRQIPVVVQTTSCAEENVSRSCDPDVNSSITKPATFEALVEAMRGLGRYRFEIVELPCMQGAS